MAKFPIGRVTFLFTDLERSTPLWEQHPDAMRAALTRHDEILRSAVESHGGASVKTTGDGLHAVFATASDAVAAAVAAQSALVVEAWPLPEVLRVRMGLHTGHAEVRDRDYYGPTVNRAARVAGIAHAGQILVSGSTAAVLDGWNLRDLGEHRLRGLPPMRLHQVIAPGLADDFPPLATAGVAVALPSPLTTFVGRGGEVDDVNVLVACHRLVTLTGAGGCGKTRLAVEVARRLASGFPDGACFVDLAAVNDERRVGDAVVGALGLAQDPARADPVARLAGYLGERAVLCVLDNCEHVLDACSALVDAVMARGTSSRLLATSRQALGVVGEQVYVVPSLAVDTEAVQLFADRAGEARAGFTVDDANRQTVAEICRHLDGIPLAIELAAARVAHLSPAQLLERFDDRFRLLAGGRRIPRHQTLTATLDWSYDLLDAREQEVLRRLAVFPASFTLEAAEAVAGGAEVIEALGSLVARSLVQIVDAGERLRYRLLETVRLYAQNRLDATEAESCRACHRDWVVDWLESVPLDERLFGDTDHFTAEHANVHAALEWSEAHGDAAAVARIAAGTDWLLGEHVQEGIRWCEAAVAAGDAVPPDLRAQLYVMLCELGSLTARGLADWTRIDDWAECGIDAAHGNPSPAHAGALRHRAFATAVEALETRDESLAGRATEFAEACVAMSQQFSAPWRMYCRLAAGIAYSTLALAWPDQLQVARDHCVAGMAVAPPAPPYLGLHAQLAAQLALHQFLAGDTSGAYALARRARGDIGLAAGYGNLEAPLTLALIIALGSGTDPGALRADLRAYHDTARRRDLGSGAAEAVVLYGGILAAVREDWELAARLLAAGARNVYSSAVGAHLYFHFRDQVRAALGPELSRKLRDDGRAMSLADAVAASLR